MLERRALNRAILARQHLLDRAAMPVEAMVEHLVGMQAQNPLDPYTGLWSRLAGFAPDQLSSLITDRRAVRMGLLRTTLHLVTDRDALALYPVVRPVLGRAWPGSPFARQLTGVDIEAVVAAARAILEQQPQTTSALGMLLHERWPDRDPSSLAYAARFLLPIVQIPPRGIWGRTSPATWTTLEAWLGRPVNGDPAPDTAVLRYLAAFGPATVGDMRIWSWVTGLPQVVERLRPQLVTFFDEAGRELLDLPDAPRPPADTPAPPRFLPAFDNLLLSHQDRSHVFAESAFGRVAGWVGTFLVDGFVRGLWRIDAKKDESLLILEPFEDLRDADSEALLDEGSRLLAFHVPAAAGRRVTFGVAHTRRPGGRVVPALGGSRAGQRRPSGRA
jgi:Winged helix DNA-binding domain